MTRHTRVDTTQSAIITDANSFPPESTTPSKDDQRQGIYPLRVYEGYNFLPTSYGYKSYFGMDAILGANGLVSPDASELVVEDVFVYQTRAFINVLVALTSHGIFIRTDGDWTRIVALNAPAQANTSLPWTFVTINQILFIYRQGHTNVFVLEDIVDGAGILMDTFNGMAVTPTRVDTGVAEPIQVFEFQPTVLNMAGQIGIFRAGGSLGFWDSDDSIAWSALVDFTDFEPSLTTLANTTKLQDQIGAITTVEPHGDGFIVYCTRSVLYAQENSQALLRYSTAIILGNVGVAYPREVAVAEPDTTHYAFTSAGLMEISGGQAQPIVPDFSDYVKRTRLPQYLTMLNNRYLCVQVMDPNFIEGNVDYSTDTVDPADYIYDGSEVGGVNIPGQVIEGDTVCFTIPSKVDPNDPSIIESGVKPYHLLQFYRQWQYKGAGITFRAETIGENEVEIADVVAGATDAGYDVVPVSMKAEEVAAFNDTVQTDELTQRQIDYYLEHYDATVLDLQTKWDEYQAAKLTLVDGVGSKLRVVGMSNLKVTGALGMPHHRFPNYKKRGLPGMDYREESSLGELGICLVDDLGDIYISPDNVEQDFLALSFLQENMEDYASWQDWLIDSDTGTLANVYYYRWVGNTETSDFVDAGLPEGGPPVEPELYIREFLIPDGGTFFKRVDDLEYNFSVPKGYVLDPTTFDSLQAYSVDGAKLALKVASPVTTALEVSESALVSDHKLVRPMPTSVELQVHHTPDPDFDGDIIYTVSGKFEYETAAGITEEGGASGSASVAGGSYKLEPATVGTITSLPEQTNAQAESSLETGASAVSDQAVLDREVAADGIYEELGTVAEAEMQADYDAQVEAIEAEGGTITKPLYNITPGSIPPSQDATWDVRWRYTLADAQFPVLVLSQSTFSEESVDLLEDLFGSIPATLPATATGAAAINAMDDETKRGLIAVHQHFYNNNRSVTELDPSFLITAAGRVDVPLGSPVGSVQEVIDEADFANRYYLLDYEGEPPTDESGASFTVPGQTLEQAILGQQRVVCGTTEDIVIDDYVRDPIVYPPWQIEVPELTWVMQNGSRAPFNPTLYGAYVYDLHLQKWGIYKGNYKHLLDYQPINNYTPGSVSYKNFMIDGGCLTDSLTVALFTDYPDESLLRYGKYQHLGSEISAIEQVHAEFRGRSSGLIAVQFSLDGRRLEYGHSVAKWYNEALSTTLNCDIVGQWATIAFTGHFDISGLRIKSNPAGRR